jgi:RimJ/RimL family protein N-acetyltransferase
MQFHVEALFTLDATGRLLAVNEPGGGRAPRFFLGRTADGNECWVRDDVDDVLTRDLHGLSESAPAGLQTDTDSDTAALFLSRLEDDAPVNSIWTGPTYCFPPDLPGINDAVRVTAENMSVLKPYLEDWVPDVENGVPLAAFLKDGKAVSICGSARITSRAHEAGVETHPDFRGQGYAVKVVAAWARAVLEDGRIPLYSTSWENQASRAVARKLGLFQYGATLHIT